MRNGYIILGDMNARFGRAVRELAKLYELPNMTISYPDIEDDIARMNDNAEFLSTICLENKLLVLNNLKTGDRHFMSSKTYRKRDIWISELDTCLVSPNLVKCVDDFAVIKGRDLPSDHAPISVTLSCSGMCLDNIIARASMLGDHAVVHSRVAKCHMTRKPIKFGNIIRERFTENISCVNIPDEQSCDDVR